MATEVTLPYVDMNTVVQALASRRLNPGPFCSISPPMSHLLSPSSPAVGELEGANYGAGTTSATDSPAIREDVLRDPRYPVHQVADQEITGKGLRLV